MIMTKDILPSIVDDSDTRRVFHEQTTMKRGTCCCSLDCIKDANTCAACMRNAEMSDMKEIVIRIILHFRISF